MDSISPSRVERSWLMLLAVVRRSSSQGGIGAPNR
jgi:hypothetical protein